MTNFKFRAECRTDVYKLLEKLPWFESVSLSITSYKLPIHRIPSQPPPYTPDVIVTLTTNPILNKTFNLENLWDILSEIEDGHVMLETAELVENYTGERVVRH